MQSSLDRANTWVGHSKVVTKAREDFVNHISYAKGLCLCSSNDDFNMIICFCYCAISDEEILESWETFNAFYAIGIYSLSHEKARCASLTIV